MRLAALVVVSLAVAQALAAAVAAAPSEYETWIQGELADRLRSHGADGAADLLRSELRARPRQTAPLLALIDRNAAVRDYLLEDGPLEVVLDNSLPLPVVVDVPPTHHFTLPGYRHRSVRVTPGRRPFTFSCPGYALSETLTLPLVSPGSPRERLIVNVGRRNDYRLARWPLDRLRRKDVDPTHGYPVHLIRPAYFWAECDEVFPDHETRPGQRPPERPGDRNPHLAVLRFQRGGPAARDLGLLK